VGARARAARDVQPVRARHGVRRRRAPRHQPRAAAARALPRRARHVARGAAAPRGAERGRAAAARPEQPHVHGPHHGDPPRGHARARVRHERVAHRHEPRRQAAARLRPRGPRLAQADADPGRRRRPGGLLLLPRGGRRARRLRRPVGEGARPRALRRGAQVDQKLRRRRPGALRAPERRAQGGAPREAVLPGAGPQVADAAPGGEELLRLVHAGRVLDVALGAAVEGGGQAGPRSAARGGAAEGRDRRVPEDAGGRDAEARQGHRCDEVGNGQQRAGEAARRVPGDGRVFGVASACAGRCMQTATNYPHAIIDSMVVPCHFFVVCPFFHLKTCKIHYKDKRIGFISAKGNTHINTSIRPFVRSSSLQCKPRSTMFLQDCRVLLIWLM
jgi:hypothetical protein